MYIDPLGITSPFSSRVLYILKSLSSLPIIFVEKSFNPKPNGDIFISNGISFKDE